VQRELRHHEKVATRGATGPGVESDLQITIMLFIFEKEMVVRAASLGCILEKLYGVF
jgi:hypothetical protein